MNNELNIVKYLNKNIYPSDLLNFINDFDLTQSSSLPPSPKSSLLPLPKSSLLPSPKSSLPPYLPIPSSLPKTSSPPLLKNVIPPLSKDSIPPLSKDSIPPLSKDSISSSLPPLPKISIPPLSKDSIPPPLPKISLPPLSKDSIPPPLPKISIPPLSKDSIPPPLPEISISPLSSNIISFSESSHKLPAKININNLKFNNLAGLFFVNETLAEKRKNNELMSGISNIGNTCFFNSFIHFLRVIPELFSKSYFSLIKDEDLKKFFNEITPYDEQNIKFTHNILKKIIPNYILGNSYDTRITFIQFFDYLKKNETLFYHELTKIFTIFNYNLTKENENYTFFKNSLKCFNNAQHFISSITGIYNDNKIGILLNKYIIFTLTENELNKILFQPNEELILKNYVYKLKSVSYSTNGHAINITKFDNKYKKFDDENVTEVKNFNFDSNSHYPTLLLFELDHINQSNINNGTIIYDLDCTLLDGTLNITDIGINESRMNLILGVYTYIRLNNYQMGINSHASINENKIKNIFNLFKMDDVIIKINRNKSKLDLQREFKDEYKILIDDLYKNTELLLDNNLLAIKISKNTFKNNSEACSGILPYRKYCDYAILLLNLIRNNKINYNAALKICRAFNGIPTVEIPQKFNFKNYYKTSGAGIIPYYEFDGKVYLMFGYDKNYDVFCDFGGAYDSQFEKKSFDKNFYDNFSSHHIKKINSVGFKDNYPYSVPDFVIGDLLNDMDYFKNNKDKFEEFFNEQLKKGADIYSKYNALREGLEEMYYSKLAYSDKNGNFKIIEPLKYNITDEKQIIENTVIKTKHLIEKLFGNYMFYKLTNISKSNNINVEYSLYLVKIDPFSDFVLTHNYFGMDQKLLRQKLIDYHSNGPIYLSGNDETSAVISVELNKIIEKFDNKVNYFSGKKVRSNKTTFANNINETHFDIFNKNNNDTWTNFTLNNMRDFTVKIFRENIDILNFINSQSVNIRDFFTNDNEYLSYGGKK